MKRCLFLSDLFQIRQFGTYWFFKMNFFFGQPVQLLETHQFLSLPKCELLWVRLVLGQAYNSQKLHELDYYKKHANCSFWFWWFIVLLTLLLTALIGTWSQIFLPIFLNIEVYETRNLGHPCKYRGIFMEDHIPIHHKVHRFLFRLVKRRWQNRLVYASSTGCLKKTPLKEMFFLLLIIK